MDDPRPNDDLAPEAHNSEQDDEGEPGRDRAAQPVDEEPGDEERDRTEADETGVVEVGPDPWLSRRGRASTMLPCL